MYDRDHLSYSQISMWLRCQKQFEFRYCDGLKVPTGAMLALGSSVHEAHESNFIQKVESTIDIPTETILDAFSDAWETRLAAEEIEFGGEKPGELKDTGAGCVQIYHETISPSVQPVAVEAPFRLEFEGSSLPVEGRIDLMTADRIIDLKTSAKSPRAIEGFDLQSATYYLADKYVYQRERPFRYDYMVKTKTPKVVQMDVPLQAPWHEFTLRLIEQVTQQITSACESGVFVPNPTHPWGCNEKFCGYWNICLGGQK